MIFLPLHEKMASALNVVDDVVVDDVVADVVFVFVVDAVS